MFESLTRYLPQLEGLNAYGDWVIDRESAGTVDDPIQMPFVRYEQTVSGVEDAICAFAAEHPDFGLAGYREILERSGLAWGAGSMAGADESLLDGQTVMAMLVGAVRAERFCDGALLELFENGCMRRWLMRLREIDGEEG